MATPDKRRRPDDEIIDKNSPNPSDKQKSKTTDGVQTMDLEDSRAVQNLNKRFAADPSTGNQQQTPFAAPATFWKSTISPANERWRLHGPSARTWKSFTKDDLFGESNDCFHSMVKPFRKLAEITLRDIATADHFERVFSQSIDKKSDISKSKEGKQMRKLALRLAKSDPIIMFSPDNWREGSLMQMDASAAWVASYKIFGAPWKNRRSFLEKTESQSKISSFASKVTPNQDKPTSKTNNADNNNPEINKKNDNPETTKNNTTMNTDDANDPDTSKTTATASSVSPENDSLPVTEIDVATSPSTVRFADTENAIPKKLAPLFNRSYLSKPLRLASDNRLSLKDRLKRKYVHYFKIKLPKISSYDASDQTKQVCNSFQAVLEIIWKLDRKSVVLGWDPQSNVDPLTAGKNLPKSREGLRTYVDKVWCSVDKSPYVRLKMAHNVDPVKFQGTDFLESLTSRDAYVSVDALQSQNIKEVGTLLGSHTGAFHAENWTQAFAQCESLKNVPLEFRAQDWKLQKKRSADYVRAVSIYAGQEKTAAARNSLLDMTSSANQDQLPLGLRVRFVPNVLDESFINTQDARMMAKRARAKQKLFTSKTMISTSHTILGLDYIIESLQTSLREAILAIRSRTDPTRNLFVMVEEDHGSSDVKFLYHETMADEAMTAIPALPLILEKELESSIVWTWFSESAKDLCRGYQYDRSKGVISTTGDYMKEALEDWAMDNDDEDSEEEFQQEMNNMTIDSVPAGLAFGRRGANFYNDDGTIKTLEFRKARSSKPVEPDPGDSVPGEASTTLTSGTLSTLSSPGLNPEALKLMLADPELREIAAQMLSATSSGGGAE
jgi:hypothetical protein